MRHKSVITRLFLTSLFLGLGPNILTPQETAFINFEPRSGWNMHGPISIRSDGRLSLTQDGQGIVWKRIELDIDKFPVMLVRAGNSLPRERWRIAVEKGEFPTFDISKAICLIDNFALEGGFIISFRKITGWSGEVKFSLMIVVDGRRGDCIEFDALEAVLLSSVKPPSPRLSAPAKGSSISRLALHYCWFEAKDAAEYELQVSRRDDFSGAMSFKITPQYLTDRLPYLPEEEELLQAGKWFWRVRGINIQGEPGGWSEAGPFTVRERAQGPRPPVLSISRLHPLIILCSDEQRLVENWKSLPDELRRYAVFRIEALPAENLWRVIQKAQENQVPVIVQTSGPHDDYGRMSARITLSEVEEILRNFPVVKGIYICEQAFRVFPPRNRIMMDYADRLIQLSAEYGKLVFWADGHWGRNLWIDVGLDEKLMATIQKHKEYFVPIWKMNCSLTPYSIHSAVFGFWVGGAVNAWGVQPEHWYWYEAGFGKLGQQAWFKEGEMAEFPAGFYGQMILLGVSTGAAVYSFEPSSDIWAPDGSLSEISRRITFPQLYHIIRHRLIPDRAAVLKKIQNVYIADSADSPWALDYGTMHALYKTMYGIEHPFQMIPSLSQSFFLPILSKWTSKEILRSFSEKSLSRKFSGLEEARGYFGKNHESPVKGDAWAIALDNTVFIMNSHENRDVDQVFEVPLKGKVSKMAGKVSVNSYLVVNESGGEFQIHLNGRSGGNLSLRLVFQNKPQKIAVIPESALADSAWDSNKNCLNLQFSLNQESVHVKIK